MLIPTFKGNRTKLQSEESRSVESRENNLVSSVVELDFRQTERSSLRLTLIRERIFLAGWDTGVMGLLDILPVNNPFFNFPLRCWSSRRALERAVSVSLYHFLIRVHARDIDERKKTRKFQSSLYVEEPDA